jgi:hypothetical protein
LTLRLAKSFDAARVPLGDESLTIQVADGTDAVERFRYVADERSADIRQLTTPQSVYVTRILAGVTLRDFGPGQAGPGTVGSANAAHSLFVVAMMTKSPVVNRYLRMLQALFASVAICLIVFFIKPIHVDPRFGLPVGAFFAAVNNNIYIASLVPETGQLTLIQMVNAISLMTIFLTLVQSAVSLYLLDSLGQERPSRMFDRVSFVVMGCGYVAVNLILPLSAR